MQDPGTQWQYSASTHVLDFVVEKVSGQTLDVFLRAPGSLSWDGINNTHFWIDPKRQIAGVVMMQVLLFYDDKSMALLRGLEGAVYQHLK